MSSRFLFSRSADAAARDDVSIVSGAFHLISRMPAQLLLGAIWLYQRTLSPVLPVVLGPNCGCRFAPTCSHYASEALREHGAVAGTWLALRRLLKCTPLHPGGFDPVPARKVRPAPACVRVTS